MLSLYDTLYACCCIRSFFLFALCPSQSSWDREKEREREVGKKRKPSRAWNKRSFPSFTTLFRGLLLIIPLAKVPQRMWVSVCLLPIPRTRCLQTNAGKFAVSPTHTLLSQQQRRRKRAATLWVFVVHFATCIYPPSRESINIRRGKKCVMMSACSQMNDIADEWSPKASWVIIYFQRGSTYYYKTHRMYVGEWPFYLSF